MYNVLQVQDLLLSRKATGRAGQAGPAVPEGNTPGHADVKQKGSWELCAEGTGQVKNTAKQINVYSKCFSGT